MKMKKLICATLTSTMLMGICSLATAAPVTNEIAYPSIDVQSEIYRAENGITDLALSDEQLSAVQAVLIDENGNEQPVDVDVTVRNLGDVRTRSGEGGTMYALTAVAGTSKDSYNDNYLWNCKAYGTIYWIDNLGTNNVMTAVDGGWEVASGVAISGRRAQYGNFRLPNQTVTSQVSSNKFNFSGLNITANELFLHTTAKLTKNGDSETLGLRVKTTIFD